MHIDIYTHTYRNLDLPVNQARVNLPYVRTFTQPKLRVFFRFADVYIFISFENTNMLSFEVPKKFL
jgi:hypothetical protein